MLSKLWRSSEWKQLRTFASPSFFDVMPARRILERGAYLKTTRTSATYRKAVWVRARALHAVPLGVRIMAAPAGVDTPSDDFGYGEQATAARVVTLYFHQLFSVGPTLLDLRASAFRPGLDALRWDPAPWVCVWDDDFQANLRQVYRGFYTGNEASFRSGLQSLELGPAADIFRQHLQSEQDNQSFVMADLVHTFHRILVRCRERRIALHPDFLPLCVYLTTLYDALDGKDAKVDVRACFEHASAHARTLQLVRHAAHQHA